MADTSAAQIKSLIAQLATDEKADVELVPLMREIAIALKAQQDREPDIQAVVVAHKDNQKRSQFDKDYSPIKGKYDEVAQWAQNYAKELPELKDKDESDPGYVAVANDAFHRRAKEMCSACGGDKPAAVVAVADEEKPTATVMGNGNDTTMTSGASRKPADAKEALAELSKRIDSLR